MEHCVFVRSTVCGNAKVSNKSKAIANLTRRVVRGIESERATHVLYHVGYAVYITCNRVALYHVRQRVGVLYIIHHLLFILITKRVEIAFAFSTFFVLLKV